MRLCAVSQVDLAPETLQWVTAAQAERAARHDFSGFLWFMLPAELLVALAGLAVLFFRPRATGVMAPFLIVWAISPLVAYLVSRRTTRAPRVLAGEDLRFAHRRASHLAFL